jgi:hypothetical protein
MFVWEDRGLIHAAKQYCSVSLLMIDGHSTTIYRVSMYVQSSAKVLILQATFAAIGTQNQPHTYCFGLCSLTEADLYYSNFLLLKPLRILTNSATSML